MAQLDVKSVALKGVGKGGVYPFCHSVPHLVFLAWMPRRVRLQLRMIEELQGCIRVYSKAQAKNCGIQYLGIMQPKDG